MRKLLILLFLSLGASSAVFAGQATKGYLKIVPDQYMIGTMNVNYNPDHTINLPDPLRSVGMDVRSHEQDGGQDRGIYTVLRFSGTDRDNNSLACKVETGEPLFEHAQKVMLSITNGSALYVRTAPAPNDFGIGKCTYITVTQLSDYLD